MKDAYTVLGLDITRTDITPTDIKAAYKQALLDNHPDKWHQRGRGRGFTVQQIHEAFLILSDPEKKRQHDKRLDTVLVQTGEIVNLADLEEHEDQTSGQFYWTKPCRCGAVHGYHLSEQELVDNGNSEEIAVQCSGCSIWIKVLYSVE